MKTSLSFIVIGFILCSVEIFAQVTIAPTNLFIDSNSKFGTYMVINGSNETQEISIDFYFAYNRTDDNDNREVVEDDSLMAQEHSIAEYIRAFPQNFTLQPDQRQIVRLRVTAPNTIPDGTYWSRIRTSSTPETPPVELQTSDAVTARVGITVKQVTGVFYKKGNVSTGIDIQDIRTSLSEEENILTVLTDITRTGNSPFLGSITTSLIDANGVEVRRALVSTSIYYDTVYQQAFELEDIPEGTYTINVTFESSRSDISSSDLVQMQPASATSTYTIR